MQEIRRSQDVVIFIDELHTLVGAGAAEGAIDASNMLKPALSRGELQCIGATTQEEYRKYIEKDGALERRFQTITINPPTIEETVDILKGLRSRYEQHHGVIISDEAIHAAVHLTDRYVTDRFLPDKAIDVMDEAGSRARLQANIKPQELKDIEKQIADYDEQLRQLKNAQEFEKCQEVKDLLGPTGVGKTELAKALAEFLFGDEDALVRIDMSEYMEKYSVSRLLGAPPGYVGYEEGGQLTEKVRRKPYSVVLLDEIEKAHPDVFSILLQVFDDGRLTDSWGHVVDFRNTVVILTSNIGTKRIRKASGMGFHLQDEEASYEAMKEKIMAEVKKTFNPEFLNRIDEIIVFRPLSIEAIKTIVDIMMRKVNERLVDKNITIRISEEVRDFLVEKGYDPEYGARPLRRTIQRCIEDPLSQLIIDGTIQENTDVETYLENEEIRFRATERSKVLVDTPVD